jgi:hypothetical protein
MVIIPHVDEARTLLIEALNQAPYLRDQGGNYNNARESGADISIPAAIIVGAIIIACAVR